jgi:hypothetical protein
MKATTLMKTMKTSPQGSQWNRGCDDSRRLIASSAGFAGAIDGGKLERGAKPPFEGGWGA